MLANQALRQGGKFGAGIGSPDHAPVFQHAHNLPAHRAPQGLDPVAGLKVRRFRESIHNLRHGLVIQHAGDAMGHGRHHFPPAGSWEFSKQRSDELASHVSEGVAVEEQERGAAVAVPQKLYGFVEGEDLLLLFLPLSAARCLSL